ncbi:MAG: 30S ribosomal protein S8 [Candidatus Omnitrophica bacterium]|nr:30S ribosomal protein S8 [Candidatus Omnitrophota bacterium]MBU1853549.1 30S ribosomal protein S8 [Candidatus Omnitrophota bacterium]
MTLTDPIANALTIVRNGIMSRKTKVDVPFSKISQEIFSILKREKFIKDFKFMDDKKQGLIRVYLKYTKTGTPAIIGLKRISKPGLRTYVKKDKIPKVLGGIGTAILSTSRGVVTDMQAKEMQTGGEVLCHVW